MSDRSACKVMDQEMAASAGPAKGLPRIVMTLAALLFASGGTMQSSTPAYAAAQTVVAPPPGAIVVGTASATCRNPQFATITAAVAAAPPDSTVYVCSGHYDEHVNITKNLTLLGAQWGVDARARADPADESVVSSTTGEFAYSGAATTGTISGFTLQGPSASANNGIVVLNNIGTGYTWIDNIIVDNETGINFHSSGLAPTVIEHNQIVVNDASGPTSGDGVLIASGAASNVTISGNFFAGNGTAINTTGVNNGSGPRSRNLRVAGNVSVNDGNFIALFLAQNVQIVGNRIKWTNPVDTRAGSAMFISGGNLNVDINSNWVSGGASTGINLNNQFYPEQPTRRVRIVANTITHRLNGILVASSSGSAQPVVGVTVASNTVTHSGSGDSVTGPSGGGNGIWLQSGKLLTVEGNFVSGSKTTDCRDQTTGSGTAHTANIWTSDIGATSSPAGLCGPPPETVASRSVT